MHSGELSSVHGPLSQLTSQLQSGHFIFLAIFSPTALELSGDYVSTIGGSALFICFPSSGAATGIQWLVNGSLVNISSSRHVTLRHTSIRTALEFMNIPVKFNMTTIQCRDERTTSIAAMLLLQGQQTMHV